MFSPVTAEDVHALFEAPRWCGSVVKAEKELGSLAKSLGTLRVRITKAKEQMGPSINICRGQKEMFKEKSAPADLSESERQELADVERALEHAEEA